jgi:VanZ family protein
LIALVMGLLFAGLYPFNFFPANQVSWIRDGRGIRFHGYGEVLGSLDVSLGSHPASDEASGVTLEFWVTCSRVEAGFNDLLSIYQSPQQEPFAIEQSISDLIIAGVVRDREGQKKFRHMSIDDAFSAGTARFITITTSRAGTTLYLEGLPRRTYAGLEWAPENFGGTLLLGQTSRAHQEWHGEIRALALYRKVLSPDDVLANYNAWRQSNWVELSVHASDAAIYRFDEGKERVIYDRGGAGGNLAIPDGLRALHPIVLAFPTRNDITDTSDVVLNIFGFIPFGALVFLYGKTGGMKDSQALVGAIAAGVAISSLIELLQVFLPSRDSSLLDVINNTLGSGLGAWLGVAFWRKFHRLEWKGLIR